MDRWWGTSAASTVAASPAYLSLRPSGSGEGGEGGEGDLIHPLFIAQAKATPDAVALSFHTTPEEPPQVRQNRPKCGSSYIHIYYIVYVYGYSGLSPECCWCGCRW